MKMKLRTFRIVAAVAVAIAVTAAAGYALYTLGLARGREMAAIGAEMREPGGAALRAGGIDPATGRRVLYWHDPMVPGRRFDAPGQSPFMDMQLVPVYEGAADDGGITVSPRMQQSLGIRTAEVRRETMTVRLEAVGAVAFNERDRVFAEARATAYVEALHARATLDPVRRGQPLAELYVPEWVAAQEEFFAVRRMRGTGSEALVDAARQRLRQVGMNEDQIRNVENRGAVEARITVVAPIDGVVAELAAREGMTVMAGETLFRINGLSTVWVNAAVPESRAPLLRPGAPSTARSLALPGVELAGTVQAILPEIDPVTRTITARIEIENPDRVLAPGMFVDVTIATAEREALVAPSEAVIRTGTRTVVIVGDGSGGFRPVDVEIGAESDGSTEITRGLEEGQSVVVSGQFLLDSEASLRATGVRMQDLPAGGASSREHTAEGRVAAFGDGTVTLSHGPIPSIAWGAMTMEFVLPPGPPPELALNERVRFSFTMSADGRPRLTKIEPSEDGP